MRLTGPEISSTARQGESSSSASTIRIVIPDTGPLITLAKADILDILLVFDDQVKVSITDVVEFEATRHQAILPDAQIIFDFIQSNTDRIQIEKTDLGQQVIADENARQRYLKNQDVQKFYAANGMPEPRRTHKNPGEISIVSFVSNLIGEPPGPPCLIIAEDDYFLRSQSGALPGNAHILSTSAMLIAMGKLVEDLHAEELFNATKKMGRVANRSNVDRPAPMIHGGTDWKSAVNHAKLAHAIAARKTRKSTS